MANDVQPRAMALWRPQYWHHDFAVDVEDAAVEFDATTELLQLSLLALQTFKSHNYDSDALASRLPQAAEHTGPFEVDCDVDAFFDANGLARTALTQEQLDALRDKYQVDGNLALPPDPATDISYEPHRILPQLRVVTAAGTSAEACREAIKAARRHIGVIEQMILDVAKAHVPDYHFLNHAVANNWLWDCPTSPIGVCVYPIDERGRCNRDQCIYCDGPEERK